MRSSLKNVVGNQASWVISITKLYILHTVHTYVYWVLPLRKENIFYYYSKDKDDEENIFYYYSKDKDDEESLTSYVHCSYTYRYGWNQWKRASGFTNHFCGMLCKTNLDYRVYKLLKWPNCQLFMHIVDSFLESRNLQHQNCITNDLKKKKNYY